MASLQRTGAALARPEAEPLPAETETNAAQQRSLYETHAPAVVRRLTHATGDADLARDLTQDTFVTAFAKLHRYRGEADVATWLHGIAFNLLRDRRKRLRRQQSVWARLRGRPAATAPEPEQALQSRQALAQLQAILAGLAEPLRDAFVLRVVEQLSLEEAAAILGARVATVSYRARRAEALVREAFDKGPQS